MERRISSEWLAVAAAVNIPLGIWLLASPYLFQYTVWTDARITDALFGPLIIGMSITRLAFWAPRYWWMSFGNVVLGLWVAISPFVLGYHYETAALIDNIVVGLLVAILAAAGLLRRRQLAAEPARAAG